jgi:hypothetical protein
MQIEEAKIRIFRSLTVTLAIAFLALSMLVLLISGSLNIYFNFQTQRQVIASQQKFIAQEAANTVKSFIQEKFSVLETAVRLGSIYPEEQKLVLEKLLGFEPAFRQLILADKQNQEALRISRLSKLVPFHLTEQAKNDMFLKVSQGKTYISQISIDEVTSEPLVIMAVPIRDVFGDFKVHVGFSWRVKDR